MKVQSLKKDPAGAQALPALQQYHVNLHVAAYGKDHVRPKMHFSLHIPEQVLRFHKLLDCFCCERKNSAFKNLMQTKGFARGFNKSVLLELVSQELHAAQEAESWGPRLLGCKLPEISIGAQRAVVSTTLDFKCIRYIAVSAIAPLRLHAARKLVTYTFYLSPLCCRAPRTSRTVFLRFA